MRLVVAAMAQKPTSNFALHSMAAPGPVFLEALGNENARAIFRRCLSVWRFRLHLWPHKRRLDDDPKTLPVRGRTPVPEKQAALGRACWIAADQVSIRFDPLPVGEKTD